MIVSDFFFQNGVVGREEPRHALNHGDHKAPFGYKKSVHACMGND